MSLNAKLQALVRELDPNTLEDFQRSIAAELKARREPVGFQMENIHARMSAEDKARAASEIARVLKERG